MSDKGLFYKLDRSAVGLVIGICLLFSVSIGVTIVAPQYIDKSWTQASSDYQVQMYEIVDPNLYISTVTSNKNELQMVTHIKKGQTLLSIQESETSRIIAPERLKKYISRNNQSTLKLTSKILLLRSPKNSEQFQALSLATQLRLQLQKEWEENHPNWKERLLQKPHFSILELYEHPKDEAFVVSQVDEVTGSWVDEDFTVLNPNPEEEYHSQKGVVYVKNPQEYRVSYFRFGSSEGWEYHPDGKAIANLEELKGEELGFLSRHELIYMGERIFAAEGCYYCHTDQTRTLVQDTVLNGSESYPAPPSTANEYIYQKISFPGTRRIGPDLSRVAVKRPSRDWHKSHFWAPKTESPGSIMPSFKHFFDFDPRGTSKNTIGVPNHQFEAMYQYLMTKGTRITAPTQAWWKGKDPVQTLDIIEGRTSPRKKPTPHAIAEDS